MLRRILMKPQYLINETTSTSKLYQTTQLLKILKDATSAISYFRGRWGGKGGGGSDCIFKDLRTEHLTLLSHLSIKDTLLNAGGDTSVCGVPRVVPSVPTEVPGNCEVRDTWPWLLVDVMPSTGVTWPLVRLDVNLLSKVAGSCVMLDVTSLTKEWSVDGVLFSEVTWLILVIKVLRLETASDDTRFSSVLVECTLLCCTTNDFLANAMFWLSSSTLTVTSLKDIHRYIV